MPNVTLLPPLLAIHVYHPSTRIPFLDSAHGYLSFHCLLPRVSLSRFSTYRVGIKRLCQIDVTLVIR